jgi:hypothetical protein
MYALTPQIIVVGHALAALAFLLLSISALKFWRDRPQSGHLAAASAISFIWSVYIAFQPSVNPSEMILEVIRDLAWMSMLFAMLKGYRQSLTPIPGYQRILFWLTIGLATTLIMSLMVPAI